MTQQWTSEPWTQTNETTATHEIMPASAHPDAEPVAILDMPDYERAIAAVNACAGVPHLPEGIVMEMRASLKALLNAHECIIEDGERFTPEGNAGRAVLAKLEASP